MSGGSNPLAPTDRRHARRGQARDEHAVRAGRKDAHPEHQGGRGPGPNSAEQTKTIGAAITPRRALGFLAVLCWSPSAWAAASGEPQACLGYSSAALPPASELVGWPDDSADIAIAGDDGTVVVGDPLGRIMGWLAGSDQRAVIYATRGALVSVTRYGAFYTLSGGALQRAETQTGATGYVPGGVVPTNDTVAAWGDDVGRYVGALRKSKGESARQQLMILDDCVVAEQRAEKPSPKEGSPCARGALTGGAPGNLPGSRAIPVPPSRSVVRGWIGADALITLEEAVGDAKAARRLVVRELSSFKTSAETSLPDDDEILVAGNKVVRWDPKARVIKTASTSRADQVSARFSQPWAKDTCWKLAGASTRAAILRCGLVDKTRWRVVDLRTGKVAWSADERVGGVRVDDRGAVWIARDDGVCKVTAGSK
jgi:hypothetical protein